MTMEKDFCGLNNLVVTGTIFPHKLIHKQTWTSPGEKTKNQIDHVLVSRQHRTSVMDTRAMRGADIASDHQLVRSKIKLKLKRKQNKAIRKIATPDISNGHQGHERSQHCERPPISAIKNQAETKEKTKQGDQKDRNTGHQ